MSHATHISRTPVASRIIPVLVVCLHVAVLGALLWGRFLKVELPKQPQSMEVELVFAKAPDEPDPPEQPAEKPIEKPIEKPVEKVVKKPKPEKKWTLAKVEDIRQRPDFKEPRAPEVVPEVDIRRITEAIRKAGIRIRPPKPGPKGRPAAPVRQNAFDAAAMAAIGKHWSDSFSASELTGPGRTVVLRFTIGSDGRVLRAKIVRRSGVLAIDGRAGRALRAIKKFPAPADYGIHSATYDITCDLEAAE